MTWHVLDVRAIWVREFACALATQVQTVGWLPKVTPFALLSDEANVLPNERGLSIRQFQLQRGFAKIPMVWLIDEGARISRRIQRMYDRAALSPLILCSPHYFSVARSWPGPRIYYATDMFRYWGERQSWIEHMEAAMCQSVDLVCPDSKRIADYMVAELGVPESKIVISPMATRAENVLPHLASTSFALPEDVADLKRPVAGIIGNLAANTDWELLERTIQSTPWLSWILVGPTDMPVDEPSQRAARTALMRAGSRVRFLGQKPYGALKEYARCIDVAILPYRKREPTYSGSSTRFYEHLAACRPMIATHGFAELFDKQEYVKIVHNADELLTELAHLRRLGFCDGREETRWVASRFETWETRALRMREALAQRVPFEEPSDKEVAVDPTGTSGSLVRAQRNG